MPPEIATKWNTNYESKAVSLLSLGSGLVGIDRYMLLALFPIVMVDLNLGYQELGVIKLQAAWVMLTDWLPSSWDHYLIELGVAGLWSHPF
jgi:hypothetical protein